MRRKIFEIVGVREDTTFLSKAYDIINIVVIILSLIPIMATDKNLLYDYLENGCVIFFIIDYILRLSTADYKLQRGKFKSFLIYPFTPMAIVDLLAILPFFLEMNPLFKALKIFRTFRAFRIFKIGRYSDSIYLIQRVLKKEKTTLLTLLSFAIMFIFISALFVFQIENEAQPLIFRNFFDALWWAVSTLTTVGYGDIYPITILGRIISMFLSILGIALIALPSGIITAGFVSELQLKKDNYNKMNDENID